jgi:anti-anti-sigma regulatory factor
LPHLWGHTAGMSANRRYMPYPQKRCSRFSQMVIGMPVGWWVRIRPLGQIHGGRGPAVVSPTSRALGSTVRAIDPPLFIEMDGKVRRLLVARVSLSISLVARGWWLWRRRLSVERFGRLQTSSTTAPSPERQSAFRRRSSMATGGCSDDPSGYVDVSMHRMPSPTAFSNSIEPSPGELRLVGVGPLDLAARGVLCDAVTSVVGDQRHGRTLVLDLTGVEMIDSSGLGELVRALLICDEHGAPWKMLPSEPVRRLLALVGVGRFCSGGEHGGWLSSGGYPDE